MVERYNFTMPGKSHSYRLQAIILRHTDWGEADRLITLYSREEGKIRAVAKGVRKLRSRKSGHLEPFSEVNLLMARGRDLPIITQAEAINPFTSLREDITLLSYASYVAELIDRFLIEEEPNQEIFQLLIHTLTRLSQGAEAAFEARFFDLKFLDLIGFKPELMECVICREKIQPQDQFFSLDLGGAVCPNCNRTLRTGIPITIDALKYLRHLQRSSYPEARKAHINPSIQIEMESLLQRYYTHLLERKLNTPQFIRSIHQLQMKATQPEED